jgi:NADPH:quinone reductase-like Zn-dependent oxidoreductase
MVHESMITPMPNGMSFEEAAALPEALLTVYLNLFKLGGLQKGQSVLVHGGSSGVGSFAISLLKANGNRVFATASSEEKIRFCRNLGADFVFSYQDNYANSIIEMGGVDLVLDMFGGEHTANSMRCLRFAGKLICIAASQGRVVNIDLAMVLKNNLQIQGSTLRNKSLQEKAELTHAAMQLYGELAMPKPTIDSVYELADYEKAFAKLMERRQMGKIVLKM